MILTFASLILTVILILCFSNIKTGTTLFLAYAILVPINYISIGSLHLGENFVRIILVLSLLYDFKIRHHYRLSWKLYWPFILYYIVELMMMPFQHDTPTFWMLDRWRFSITRILVVGFVIYNVLSIYPETIKLYRRALLFSILTAGIYGILLTTSNGFNPYINAIILSTGTIADAQDRIAYFMADDRLFGRISSVFMHPMSFGLFIGLSFIYVFSIRKKISKRLIIPLLSILSLDALFCGVRSCIGGLVIATSFYLIFSKNLKIGLTTLFIGLIAYNIISQMPELSEYLSSMTSFDNSKTNVSGSSIDMRLNQLNGCLAEIRNNPIFGKGFEWTSYYHEKYGDHPVILAFESLIFVILCNNGYMGFIIWGILIYMIIKRSHKYHLNDVIIADSLLVFYIAYSCITGEYGYMQYYLLFYVCLVFDNSKSNKEGSKPKKSLTPILSKGEKSTIS